MINDDNFSKDKDDFMKILKLLSIPIQTNDFEEKIIKNAIQSINSKWNFYFIKFDTTGTPNFRSFFLRPKVVTIQFIIVVSICLFLSNIAPQDDVMATDLISELSLATI